VCDISEDAFGCCFILLQIFREGAGIDVLGVFLHSRPNQLRLHVEPLFEGFELGREFMLGVDFSFSFSRGGGRRRGRRRPVRGREEAALASREDTAFFFFGRRSAFTTTARRRSVSLSIDLVFVWFLAQSDDKIVFILFRIRYASSPSLFSSSLISVISFRVVVVIVLVQDAFAH
jgi:hypothetical protein